MNKKIMKNKPKENISMHRHEDLSDDYSSPLIEEFSSAVTAEALEQTDYKMKLASKIYKTMKVKGLNKTEVAAAMGNKQVSLVSSWLSGTDNFNIDVLVEIEKVLGVS